MRRSRLAEIGTTAILALTIAARAAAQQAAPPARVAVFLDCQTFCDFNHVRQEITFVDWVRDRNDADVHLLMTSQATGGSGTAYTLAFIGLRRFAGQADTLTMLTRSTDVQDDIRNAQARTIKLGLVRFAAHSGVAERLHIAYEGRDSTTAAPTTDPWNAWVFQLGLGGSADGQQSNKSWSVNSSASANRVTDAWKVQLSTNGRRSSSSYLLQDSTTFTNDSHNYSADALVVRSLGDHWSLGVRANASSSTYLNQSLSATGGPALEFDIYPYAQSTRQQITLQYSIGPARYVYEDTTIFDRTSETRVQQTLQISASVTQPWGSVSGSVQGSQYLDNLGQHSVSLFGGTNIRVFRGFSFNVFANVQRIKDQIYLAKAGATDQEILVQQRQLGTDYSYSVNLSFSYRFGSSLNNVVNPRFSGGGGMFFMN